MLNILVIFFTIKSKLYYFYIFKKNILKKYVINITTMKFKITNISKKNNKFMPDCLLG